MTTVTAMTVYYQTAWSLEEVDAIRADVKKRGGKVTEALAQERRTWRIRYVIPSAPMHSEARRRSREYE